jgi:two-component system, NtrC family, sensor histidine kinase KinB
VIGFLVGMAVGACAGAAAVEWRRRKLDREREAVFAFAAHELASPTTGVQLTIRNLLQGLFGEVSADQRRWLEVSQDQIVWLAGVAADLGDLAHIEFGRRLRVTSDSFDPMAETVRAVESWKKLAERWGVELELESSGGGSNVRSDPARIARVITNLIGHGLRFSAPKGRVRVSVDGDGGRARVSVTWTPLDPAVEPSDVLDRFCVARAGKTLKISGVGLTVAREVVDRCGGALRAERDGKLDRFVLALPRPT